MDYGYCFMRIIMLLLWARFYGVFFRLHNKNFRFNFFLYFSWKFVLYTLLDTADPFSFDIWCRCLSKVPIVFSFPSEEFSGC